MMLICVWLKKSFVLKICKTDLKTETVEVLIATSEGIAEKKGCLHCVPLKAMMRCNRCYLIHKPFYFMV